MHWWPGVSCSSTTRPSSAAADIEGHPDNVAPAFYGGFVISGREADEWFAVSAGVDPRVSAVVFVPPTPVETTVARGLLPDLVPHADAAANSGRAALLVAALAGRPEHLLAATRDYLHQEQREPAMPESLAARPCLARRRDPGRDQRCRSDRAGLRRRVAAPSSGSRVPHGWACHALDIEAAGVLVGE